MTQGCVEFAKSEAEWALGDPVAKTSKSTYALEIAFDVFDPKAFDQFYGQEPTEGKTVDGGTWVVKADNLDYLMSYAEGLNLTWRADRLCRPDERYVTGRFEIRREGLPLLVLEHGKWSTVGDDYLDPWQEEATSETQLMVSVGGSVGTSYVNVADDTLVYGTGFFDPELALPGLCE